MVGERIVAFSVGLAIAGAAAGCTAELPSEKEAIAQREAEGFVDPHNGQVTFSPGNRCAWSPQNPMPQPSAKEQIIDTRCGFPLNPDGSILGDQLDIYEQPDRVRSVAVVKTGAVVTYLCFTVGEKETDAAGRSSKLWGKVDIPVDLDPDRRAFVGFLPAHAFGYALPNKPC